MADPTETTDAAGKAAEAPSTRRATTAPAEVAAPATEADAGRSHGDPEPAVTGGVDDNHSREARIVNAWVHERIANTAIARQTDLWNVLQQALPALVEALISGE